MDSSVVGLSIAALECATAVMLQEGAMLGRCSCLILGKVCRTLLFPILEWVWKTPGVLVV